ncbi:MAG: Rieske 2Fe-2S domain-containing protein [Methanomassiliicoccales archaeon]
MKIRVASASDILSGGMMMVQAQGIEMVLCNFDGTFYAMERRCGHMCAPLELGTLNGYILTCPMHSAQFSVVTGEAINNALPSNRSPPKIDGPAAVPGYLAMLIQKVKTMDVRSFPVIVEGEDVFVDV